jgi:hypothetical protein
MFAPARETGRATHVPNKADTSGNERSTTVNSISVMSWRPLLEQYELIPAICLIRKRSQVQGQPCGRPAQPTPPGPLRVGGR